MTLLPDADPSAFRPLLKWPGGKAREWRHFAAHVPTDVRHFVDPFMGGLAPFALTPFGGCAWLNDLHPVLVDAHRRVQSGDPAFFAACDALATAWDACGPLARRLAAPFRRLLETARRDDRAPHVPDASVARAAASLRPFLAASLADKALRLARLERKHGMRFGDDDCRRHGETAVRAALYTQVRAREHRGEGAGRAADFLFVREFCYGSMFRVNKDGVFNIPYGGASYNRKRFTRVVKRLRAPDTRQALERATFSNEDFETFLDRLDADLSRRDLVFLDPPYDSDFSTYGGNAFTLDDHERLALAMARTPARVLLVIQETDEVRRIYVDGAPHAAGARVVLRFGKQYGYNVRGRNVRDTHHVVIARL